jgi:Flp pilus assembly protein protease CpaA
MKSAIYSIFLFLALQTYSQEQAPKQLNHFMQKLPSPADAIPYGANPNAGHYASSGDAKI